MPGEIHCNLCGSVFDGSLAVCPKCLVASDLLDEPVQLPPPRGVVNDFVGLLTSEQENLLAEITSAFFERTEVPVVITTVVRTEPLTPGEYAFLLYNHWGIGKAGVDMGLLILLCLEEKRLESEVGLGLEAYLSEETGDWIVQNAFLPYLRDGDYFAGLKAGTEAVIDALTKRLPTVT